MQEGNRGTSGDASLPRHRSPCADLCTDDECKISLSLYLSHFSPIVSSSTSTPPLPLPCKCTVSFHRTELSLLVHRLWPQLQLQAGLSLHQLRYRTSPSPSSTPSRYHVHFHKTCLLRLGPFSDRQCCG
jgi:hypothetical protein